MKKWTNKIIMITLIMAFITLSSLPARAWSDWAKEDVNYLILNGMIEMEKLSKSNEKITRGEFAYLGVKLYEAFTGKEASRGDAYFQDTYDDYVLMAKNHKIVSGYPDGTFHPEKEITRQELSILFVNLLDAVEKSHSLKEYEKFADDAAIASWASKQVYTCRKYKIVAGMGNNMFMPNEHATVEQALVMFKRVYDTFNDSEYLVKFGDVNVNVPQENEQENPKVNPEKPQNPTPEPSKPSENKPNQNVNPPVIGKRPPLSSKWIGNKAITFSTQSVSNQKVDFNADKRTVIHFYSSDLSSSVDAIRYLLQIRSENPNYNYVFVDVSAKSNAVQKLIKDELKVDYIPDTKSDIYNAYGIKFAPITFFVGADGMIKEVVQGNVSTHVYQKVMNNLVQ